MDRKFVYGELLDMNSKIRVLAMGSLTLSLSCWFAAPASAEPTPAEALGMRPVQADVQPETIV